MKIQQSTPQLQCSAKVARAPGHHTSILCQPRSKRDLPALRKLTVGLKKKKKSKKTSYFESYIMGLVSMQSTKKAVSGKEDEEPKAAETIGENIADEGVKVRRCQAELQSSLDGQYWTMQPTTGRAGRKRKQTVFFSPSFWSAACHESSEIQAKGLASLLEGRVSGTSWSAWWWQTCSLQPHVSTYACWHALHLHVIVLNVAHQI